MLFSTLRPLLLLIAGAVAGSLITFGLLNRRASVKEDLVQSGTPPRMLKAPLASRQEEGDLDNAASRTVSQDTSDSEEQPPDPKVSAAFKATQQRIPVRPVATPKVVFQANGLPVGVTPDAGISEAYAKLPGVQPPLINRDGRDMGPEAIHMLEMHREEVPFPGGIPSVSATPMPFPQTVEEANRQAQVYASPSPGP
jgi:hypothetical protein